MGGCEGNPYPTLQTFITGIDTPFAEGGTCLLYTSTPFILYSAPSPHMQKYALPSSRFVAPCLTTLRTECGNPVSYTHLGSCAGGS